MTELGAGGAATIVAAVLRSLSAAALWSAVAFVQAFLALAAQVLAGCPEYAVYAGLFVASDRSGDRL